MTTELFEKLLALVATSDREECQSLIEACRRRIAEIAEQEMLDALAH